jgi:hypothetical protein
VSSQYRGRGGDPGLQGRDGNSEGEPGERAPRGECAGAERLSGEVKDSRASAGASAPTIRMPPGPSHRSHPCPPRAPQRPGARDPPPPPPPSPCTKWTRLVVPPVLSGHVSSFPPY